MRVIALIVALVLSLAAAPARATFHFMQIEQIIGGVNGDTSMQAIQLRMRFGSQNFVTNVQVRVYDAAGQNPITIVNCDHTVPNGTTGSRIVIASPNFASAVTPAGFTPDFVMTNLIPASYLAAGRMTWESFGTIYWSVAWGGAGYTGLNTGSVTNDANGNFGPAFAGALPSTTLQSLRFTGAAGDASTTNAAQYALSNGAAIFTTNAVQVYTVIAPPTPCLQDFNEDGNVNADDLGDYITCFFSDPPCEGAEFNGDGNVNADDLGDFITTFFGPPC